MSVQLSLTCSTIFLVPHLGIDRTFLLDKEIGFSNAYLQDKKAELQYDEFVVFLLFNPTNITKFAEFLEAERERGLLVDEYDYENGFTVLVYSFPEGFEKDVQKFHDGKYSRFSSAFRKVYPEKVLVKNALGKSEEVPGLAWRVITKSQDVRDFWERELGFVFSDEDEVWQKPLDTKETLDIGSTPIRSLI